MLNRATWLLTLLFIFSTQHGKSNNPRQFISFNDTLKLKFWNDFILIPIKTDSLESYLIFDNGASISALDSIWLSKTGVADANNMHVKITDANSKSMYNKLHKTQLQIGSFHFRDMSVIEIKVNHLLTGCQVPFAGLLGADIINQLNWNFNFDDSTLVISKIPFKQSGTVISYYTYLNNLHYTEIQFYGNKKARANIDFGYSNETILFPNTYLSAFSGKKAVIKYGQTGISLSGLDDFDSTFILPNNKCSISGKLLIDSSSFEFSANEKEIRIGNPVFRKFNIILNTTTQEYILSARKLPYHRQSLFYGISLYWMYGKCRIINILTNESIKINDLHIDDEIIKINKQNVSDFMDNCALYQLLKISQNAGKSIEITLANGKSVLLQPMPLRPNYILP
ncbi:MAG TPA: hypothetical protein PKO18_07920 [Chitinophagales bacterium]|nr:hypothetical protein [Chitinophagales bacterium]HNL85149.1 hypothetical protein [Chitinophagales bacterium]